MARKNIHCKRAKARIRTEQKPAGAGVLRQSLGAEAEADVTLLLGAQLNIADLRTGYEGCGAFLIGDLKRGAVMNSVGHL